MFSPKSRLVRVVLVCSLIAVALTGAAHAQSFATQVPYPVSANPNSAVAADFNGDNKTDLAVANVLGFNVSVLINKGDGTFNASVFYPVQNNPETIATADLNADGKLDLAVGNFFGGTLNDGSVSILLGKGDGTFNPAVHTNVHSPIHIVIADLNADNKLDLAISSARTDNLSIMLGNGNGTFQAPVTYAVGDEPRQLGVADFNGDTKPDVAINVASAFVNYVAILIGNGNGTFQTPVNVPTGSTPIGLITREINGDGKVDLVIAAAHSNAVQVFLGNGDGSFQNPVNYTVGQEPLYLTMADFNGDGPADVIIVNASGSSYSVLRGNANGTFQAAVTTASRFGSWAPINGDFNSDGKPDLAIANNINHLIDVYINSPSALGLAVSTTQGVSVTAPVATFIDFDATKTAASFTATINWGDGTATSAGTITTGVGGFNVTGTHTYVAPGTFTITTQIADSSGNFESTTSTATVKALTSTAVSTSVTPSDFGQSVTFTATVTSSAGTPGGSVQFKDGGTNLGAAATLNASGVATIATSALTAGTHVITADYLGNTNFAPSSGTLSGGQVVRPQPTLSIGDASIVEGDSGTKTLSFTTNLSAASNLTVTVAIATANLTATAGADYVAFSGTLTFNPGETSKNTSITINTDGINEFDETFAVNLSTPTNASLLDGQGVGTIVNDDAPILMLDDLTGRALALDSVNFTRDPFTLLNPFNLEPSDQRRRIALFVWNLGLLPSDTEANLTVTAEDNTGGTYTMVVEHLSEMTDPNGLAQIVVRLPDNVVGAPRDLTLKVQLRGPASNGAVIKIAAP